VFRLSEVVRGAAWFRQRAASGSQGRPCRRAPESKLPLAGNLLPSGPQAIQIKPGILFLLDFRFSLTFALFALLPLSFLTLTDELPYTFPAHANLEMCFNRHGALVASKPVFPIRGHSNRQSRPFGGP
jgi:hypothetical protein